MRRFRALAIGAAVLFAACAQSALAASPDGFVRVSGARFVLDGTPFIVAGVNNHYLAYGYDEEVTRVLDDAVAMHANVVRTFLQPVIGSLDGSTPTIWNWRSTSDSSNLGVHGRYMLSWRAQGGGMAINDGADGLQRLDFVLAEAGRRHLKVIVALLDFWAYTGGAQQMSAWYGSQDKYTFFAQDERTRRDYKVWANHVILRRNALTGLLYRDDPAIFSWELMNEPDIQPRSLLLNWVSEASAFIKSIDGNHLVSTGHSNIVNKLADLPTPTVDFGTWHGYAGYEQMTVAQFSAQIRAFCAKGALLNKPVLLEEFGLAGNEQDKTAAYDAWISTVINDPNCAGWLLWRLVSRQQNGSFPSDSDGFDIHNDGGGLWRKLQDLSIATQARP